MGKFYMTSVRKAAKELVYLGNGQEYTSSYEESELNKILTEEIIQWLVDRDKRFRKTIMNLKKARFRNVTHIPN